MQIQSEIEKQYLKNTDSVREKIKFLEVRRL